MHLICACWTRCAEWRNRVLSLYALGQPFYGEGINNGYFTYMHFQNGKTTMLTKHCQIWCTHCYRNKIVLATNVWMVHREYLEPKTNFWTIFSKKRDSYKLFLWNNTFKTLLIKLKHRSYKFFLRFITCKYTYNLQV